MKPCKFYSLVSAIYIYICVENGIATKKRLLLYYYYCYYYYCYNYYRSRIYSCCQDRKRIRNKPKLLQTRSILVRSAENKLIFTSCVINSVVIIYTYIYLQSSVKREYQFQLLLDISCVCLFYYAIKRAEKIQKSWIVSFVRKATYED